MNASRNRREKGEQANEYPPGRSVLFTVWDGSQEQSEGRANEHSSGRSVFFMDWSRLCVPAVFVRTWGRSRHPQRQPIRPSAREESDDAPQEGRTRERAEPLPTQNHGGDRQAAANGSHHSAAEDQYARGGAGSLVKKSDSQAPAQTAENAKKRGIVRVAVGKRAL